jgi:hypothetical protein
MRRDQSTSANKGIAIFNSTINGASLRVDASGEFLDKVSYYEEWRPWQLSEWLMMKQLQVRSPDFQHDEEYWLDLEAFAMGCVINKYKYKQLEIRAFLLLVYALLKAGSAELRRRWWTVDKLAMLAVVKHPSLPESSAARWCLGRAYHARSAIEEGQTKIDYLRLGKDMFETVVDAKLGSYPVLLPGVVHEYPPDLFPDNLSPGDPLVYEVHPPYRYKSSALTALSEFDNVNRVSLLKQALAYDAVMRDIYPGAEIALLNSSLSANTARTLLNRIDRRKAAPSIKLLIEDIDKMAKDGRIPTQKALEWRAGVWANHAIALEGYDAPWYSLWGQDRRSAVTEVQKCIKEAVKQRSGHPDQAEYLKSNRVADFWQIDPPYRRAMDGMGMDGRRSPARFEHFLASL